MTLKSIHNSSDGYIASHRKNGRHLFAIASTRLEALRDCLAQVYKLNTN